MEGAGITDKRRKGWENRLMRNLTAVRPALLLTLWMTLLVTACSQGGNNGPIAEGAKAGNLTEDTVETADTEGRDAAPAEPSAAYASPLTGLPLQAESTVRPVAVMINNFGPARPQSGLPQADMVWEVLAEGGITRLVAIFQSDAFTGPIGPIRSIRPYLIDIAESFGSIIAHAGGSQDAYAILQRRDKPYLDEITNASGFFYRDKSRKAPHNLYSSLDKLREAADKKGYDATASVPVFRFMETAAPPAGADATAIELQFMLKNYKVSYAYDAATQLYSRSVNGKPHTDRTSGEQLKAANLVVLSAAHKVLDDEGRLEVDLQSGGPAILFQLGKAVEATWERGGDGVIRIMKDGSELPFVPGKTYYHVVPNDTPLAGHVTYQ